MNKPSAVVVPEMMIRVVRVDSYREYWMVHGGSGSE
jgi:hypothetical protein